MTYFPHENPNWLTQPNWYINSATGDDANDGATSGTALATINEYLRRMGNSVITIAGDGIQRVYLSGSFDEGTYLFRANYSFGVEFIGERTVIGTGTISDLQIWDAATSTDGYIEDDSIPTSWTASGFVGEMIALTSGAQTGAFAWIGKDLGSKIARISEFTQMWGFASVTPSISDTYEIVTLLNIKGAFIFDNVTGGWGFNFQDINFEFDTTVGIKNQNKAFTVMYGCSADGDTFGFGFMSASGWIWDWFGSKINMGVGRIDVSKASVFGIRFCLLVSRVVAENGSQLEIHETLMQNNFKGDTRNLSISINNGAGYTSFSGALRYYDGNSGINAFNISRNSWARFYTDAKIFGTGNAGTGIHVAAGGTLLYPDGDNATAHFDITTSGTEVRYGGTDTTYAAVGTTGIVNAANNAMIVPTE